MLLQDMHCYPNVCPEFGCAMPKGQLKLAVLQVRARSFSLAGMFI